MGKGMGIWVTLAAIMLPSLGVAQTRSMPGGLTPRKPTTLPLPGEPDARSLDRCRVALAPNNHFYVAHRVKLANVWAVVVYCWPEAVGGVALLLALKLFSRMRRYRRRRRVEPHCEKCDYCLVGLMSDRCPECGEPVSKSIPRSRRFVPLCTAIYALVIVSLVCAYPLLRWERVERCPELPPWAIWWSAATARFLSQHFPGSDIQRVLVRKGGQVAECTVDGKVVREFAAVDALIFGIRLSLDGSTLMTQLDCYDRGWPMAEWSASILWDTRTGKQLYRTASMGQQAAGKMPSPWPDFEQFYDDPVPITSKDGRFFASSLSEDGRSELICVFDSKSRQPLAVLDAPVLGLRVAYLLSSGSRRIRRIVFSEDGTHLYVFSVWQVFSFDLSDLVH